MVPSSFFSQFFFQKLGRATASGSVASGQGIRSVGQLLNPGKESVLHPHFPPNPQLSDASEVAEGYYFYANSSISKM